MKQINRFKSLLKATIDKQLGEILSQKPEGKKHLNYVDAITITSYVRNIFIDRLGMCPDQVAAACELSKAVLAPSAKERMKLIKAAISIGGGTAGISMIVSGVCMAAGLGAGMAAKVVALFVGASLGGPVALISIGVAVAAIAGYIALTGNPQKDTQRFIESLTEGLNRSVDAIWEEHGKELMKN